MISIWPDWTKSNLMTFPWRKDDIANFLQDGSYFSPDRSAWSLVKQMSVWTYQTWISIYLTNKYKQVNLGDIVILFYCLTFGFVSDTFRRIQRKATLLQLMKFFLNGSKLPLGHNIIIVSCILKKGLITNECFGKNHL
jgi:hypothetical protein